MKGHTHLNLGKENMENMRKAGQSVTTVVVHNPTANVRNGNTGDIMEHPTVIDYEFEPFNSRAVSSIQEIHIAHLFLH